MKAPVARMGGKSRLAKVILSHFPEEYEVYVEPFVGAGNILFRRPIKHEVRLEVVNDIDPRMYHMLEGLKNNAVEIHRDIQRNITRAHFWKSKENPTDAKSIIECIKMSFFGKGTSYNASREGQQIKTDYACYGPRLKDVIIRNEPFQDIMDEFDYPDAFFYLDPPYENSDKFKDYPDSVKPEAVYDAVKKLECRFLLSYNDSENIRELFKEYTIIEVETKYSGKAKGEGFRKKTELLIKNY